jgi:hypothetical protein
MKTSAAFASGLWIGALAAGVAGAVYLHTFHRTETTGDAATTKTQDVAEKLRVSQADCARLGAEITQLKRTIDEQRKQMGRTPTPPPVPSSTTPETSSTPTLPTLPSLPEPDVPDQPGDEGLTATDAATGITVSLEDNGLVLVASDQQGKRLWTVNLESPARSVTIQGGHVTLTFIATVTMDLATGRRSN